jgi:lipoyl(octanoyl) transferase
VRTIEVRRLGTVPYSEALQLQRELVEERRAGRVPDLLLLLQHPPVITLGVKGDGGRSNVLVTGERLAELGVEVSETGRGGDVTYHGPGQIVGYPILDLKPDRCDVHRYVRDLEEVMIRVCADYGVTAGRIKGLTGTWVGNEKIGAIGVRISRWITSDGSRSVTCRCRRPPGESLRRGVCSVRLKPDTSSILGALSASVCRTRSS